MTTAKTRSTTGSKLANSVRRAKTTQTDENETSAKATTTKTASTAPAAKTTRKSAAKPAAKKPVTAKSTETETIRPMPSNRVWPD